ncbi:MAG TPA: caspase family protein, partial [Tepidisphaeraceae bacterium]|nr:caspase family protein [Tepidisphaeraceae bacterium]
MRRLLLLAVIILQICIGRAAVAGERIALVIGNSDYRNAPHLPNPFNDATDVAAALERLGFSVQLIRNGSFDTMRRSLMDFAQQVAGADIALLYFAGHGMEIRDENWLIPIDAELRMDVLAGQETISLGSVMPIIAKAKRLGLVILDACRDNPFGRQMQISQP